MEFFFDDDERYEKCIYSINRGIAAQQFHHFWSKIHVLMIYGKNGGNMLVSSCVFLIADRHGEFTTHQPSPPVCLVVKCVAVKMKKNEF